MRLRPPGPQRGLVTEAVVVSGGEIQEPDQRAKLRANDRRREESPGYNQPRLSRVDAISGDSRRRPATVKTYLTSEGSLVRTQLRPPGGLHVSAGCMFTFGPGSAVWLSWARTRADVPLVSAETSRAIALRSPACGLAALNLGAGMREGRIRAGQAKREDLTRAEQQRRCFTCGNAVGTVFCSAVRRWHGDREDRTACWPVESSPH